MFKTLACPNMAYTQDSVSWAYLHNRAAIYSHRKHDPFKPLLYFVVNPVDRDSDERS